jgi:hypothetical protein
VVLTAFGRSVTLSKDDLAKLKILRFSNVTIYYETGLPITGGYGVFFRLSDRPYFISDPFEKQVDQKASVEYVIISMHEKTQEIAIERRVKNTHDEGGKPNELPGPRPPPKGLERK